ncbi:hypothetical protein Peur_024422 [Populus x canadensis]
MLELEDHGGACDWLCCRREVAGGGGAVGLRCCYCTVEEKVAAPAHVAGLGMQRSYWSLLLMAGTDALQDFTVLPMEKFCRAAVVAPIGRELLMKPITLESTMLMQRCW